MIFEVGVIGYVGIKWVLLVKVFSVMVLFLIINICFLLFVGFSFIVFNCLFSCLWM